jgi:hypothetical protein
MLVQHQPDLRPAQSRQPRHQLIRHHRKAPPPAGSFHHAAPKDPRPNITPFSMTHNADMTGPYTVPPGLAAPTRGLAAPTRRIRLYDTTAPTRLTKRRT